MSIYIICGTTGVGKTKFMTALAYEKYLKRREFLKPMKKEIERLNFGGFNFDYTKIKHTVFSDYTIMFNKRICSYSCNGFDIGLPANDGYKRMLLPPYSQIFLDEAQKYYNSRLSMYLKEAVSRFYEIHRHNHYDLYLTCQREGLIDLNIREVSVDLIYLLETKDKLDSCNNIKKSVWTYLKFDSNGAMQRFLDSGNQKFGKKQKFVINYDVFRKYDSFDKKYAFYNEADEKTQFDIIESTPVEKSLLGFQKANIEHSFFSPSGYYKEKRRV